MVIAPLRLFGDQPHERSFQVEEANDFHIGKMVRVVNERLHEILRLSAVGTDKNPFAAGNGTDRRLRGNNLLLICLCHTLPPELEIVSVPSSPEDAARTSRAHARNTGLFYRECAGAMILAF